MVRSCVRSLIKRIEREAQVRTAFFLSSHVLILLSALLVQTRLAVVMTRLVSSLSSSPYAMCDWCATRSDESEEADSSLHHFSYIASFYCDFFIILLWFFDYICVFCFYIVEQEVPSWFSVISDALTLNIVREDSKSRVFLEDLHQSCTPVWHAMWEI
jgi:hypothetical protein